MSNAQAIQAVIEYCKQKEIAHGGYKGIRENTVLLRGVKSAKVVYLLRSPIRFRKGNFYPYSVYYVDELLDGSIRVDFTNHTKNLPDGLIDVVR